MANKEWSIKITGDDEVGESLIQLFARQFGWTEKVLNDEGEEIDNPVTAFVFGANVLRNFMRENAKSRALADAVIQIEEQAKQSLDALNFGFEETTL